MKKREFLKVTGIVGAGIAVAPFIACNDGTKTPEPEPAKNEPQTILDPQVFILPRLPYAAGALEPHIDAMTVQIHHGKHHAGYVKKLNKALASSSKFQNASIEEIMSGITADDTSFRNNGGGHYNHSLYWEVIAPGGGNTPTGNLADAMNSAFGSIEEFKSQFFTAAKTRFGSGWAWLTKDANGKLSISSTPNQDNPLMTNLVDQTGTPILGIDVWEHAYYLKYQNERGKYINGFMDLINWDTVASKYAAV